MGETRNNLSYIVLWGELVLQTEKINWFLNDTQQTPATIFF